MFSGLFVYTGMYVVKQGNQGVWKWKKRKGERKKENVRKSILLVVLYLQRWAVLHILALFEFKIYCFEALWGEVEGKIWIIAKSG